MPEMPKEMEEKILEFQQAQEQLQLIVGQKMQFKMQMDEIGLASESLESAKGKVYKSTGAIIIEADKGALGKELGEKKEMLTVRMQVLGKQEEKLRKRLLELRSELESGAKGMPPTKKSG